MNRARIMLVCLTVASLSGATAHAQPRQPAGKKGPTTGSAAKKAKKFKKVKMKGHLVDIHSFMTGEYGSDEHTKQVRKNIKAGVPAVLKTTRGLVILGRCGPDTLAPLANRPIKLEGKLYNKNGVKYLAVTSTPKPAPKAAEREIGGKKKE